MANLNVAPQKQVDAARAAYKKFKALATANGLHYCRVYTSYNTRTQQVRVKVYAIGGPYSKCEAKVNKLGFKLHKFVHRFGGYDSLVAYF